MKKFFLNTFRFIGALLALIRGVMILSMLVVGIITVYLIYVTANVTINQYNETLTWKNTAYEVPLAEIEPALVANRMDTDIVGAAAAWDDLETYLNSLDGQFIPDRETAETLLAEAVKWQETYNLKSDSIARLSLYLELEDAISEAYDTLNTNKLQELAQTLYNLELEEKTEAGQQYMERIRNVSSDFAEARNVMTETILSVGTVENGIWTIPYTYTRTDLTEVLEQVESMEKFPDLCNSADVLSDIADVLNYNKNAREYFEYQEFAESIANIKRSQYVAVSSIYTYEQALAFGCNIYPECHDGYTINPNSPVTGIYHDGERLDNNQYVKKGTQLTAEISEIYDPIPVIQPEFPVNEPEQTPVEENPIEGAEEYYE